MKVKRSLMVKMTDSSSYGQSRQVAQFEDLFVQRHSNVSILYADIVNFTPLSETLSAYQLVATLNQLFGKFDQIAQEKQCMRIKILGDCYYCVSGLPVSRPNHAINIVRMGLAMIEAIRWSRRMLLSYILMLSLEEFVRRHLLMLICELGFIREMFYVA